MVCIFRLTLILALCDVTKKIWWLFDIFYQKRAANDRQTSKFFEFFYRFGIYRKKHKKWETSSSQIKNLEKTVQPRAHVPEMVGWDSGCMYQK